MAFGIYKSTDTAAPTLAGLSGSLIQLLDCVLVTGYGNHSGAGWAKEYSSGPALAVYRAPVGNRLRLRIDDSTGFYGHSGGSNANAIGYETMTSVFSGTNAFPQPSQGFGTHSGIYIRKSATSGAEARQWKCYADNRTIYLFILNGDRNDRYTAFTFGEFTSVNSNDDYATLIGGRTNPSSLATADLDVATTSTGPRSVSVAARRGAGVGTAVKLSQQINGALMCTDASAIGGGALEFPNGADGGIYLSDIVLYDQDNAEIRGYMRGMLNWCHAIDPVADGDYFQGTGADSSKSFDIVKYSYSMFGLYVIETSNTLSPS
jgi:hypothetical protein